MTTDGPYSDSIRSDTPSGIGGIWTLLNAVSNGLSSLPQIAADVAALRIIAERIAGPTDAIQWPGLSAYLSRYIGNPAIDAGSNALPTLWSYTRLLLQGVGGVEAATLSLNQGLLNEFGNEGDVTGRTLAQLQLTQAQIETIMVSLGIASSSTPNFSALAWLALIANSTERSADCCENGPVVPIDPYPIPTPFCGTGPAYWQECELRLRFSTNPPDPLDVYALWPPSSMIRAENIGRINSVDGSGGFDPGLGVVNGIPLYPEYPVCIAWSFSPAPLLYDYDYNSVLRGTGNKYTSYVSSSTQAPNVGTELKTWFPFSGSSARALQANFAFPGGTAIAGKVWISLSEPPPV